MVYMELYPNIINIKKSDLLIKYLVSASAIVVLLCMYINSITTPQINWSFIVTVSIVYIWATVLYSIKKNVNIAAHVLMQTVSLSILVILLDLIIGYKSWSFYIALPIIIGCANLIMFVLTIVCRKKFFKYVPYELSLTLVSIIGIVLMAIFGKYKIIPISITASIIFITFILVISLCGRDVIEELKRFFHV